jgi:hypothetical protein
MLSALLPCPASPVTPLVSSLSSLLWNGLLLWPEVAPALGRVRMEVALVVVLSGEVLSRPFGCELELTGDTAVVGEVVGVGDDRNVNMSLLVNLLKSMSR